jgi:FkbM family methyltransferase
MISYAQNFEDVLLARVFCGKSAGFYVDVGAHDPEQLSITKHFYDLGWQGINIEPVPASHRRLVRHRPRDVNLAVAAGRSESYGQIYVPDEVAFATLDLDHVAEVGTTTLKLKVPVRTLNAILEENNVSDIDFLSIDVEGAEKDVLEGIDLFRFRPVVIVVEATRPGARWDFDAPGTVLTHSGWEPLVLGRGYHFAYFDGLNRFYVREEDKELRRFFEIPVGPVRDNFRLNGLERTLPRLEAVVLRHLPSGAIELLRWARASCRRRLRRLRRAFAAR